MDILVYGQLSNRVYLMVYEERDWRFIDALDLSLARLPIGPSWFVNHNKFLAPDASIKRDIDVIMVASWALFKRHRHFFRGLSELKNRGQSLRVVLVGYPVDLQQEDIRALAASHGIEDVLTIYEWIQPVHDSVGRIITTVSGSTRRRLFSIHSLLLAIIITRTHYASAPVMTGSIWHLFTRIGDMANSLWPYSPLVLVAFAPLLNYSHIFYRIVGLHGINGIAMVMLVGALMANSVHTVSTSAQVVNRIQT